MNAKEAMNLSRKFEHDKELEEIMYLIESQARNGFVSAQLDRTPRHNTILALEDLGYEVSSSLVRWQW